MAITLGVTAALKAFELAAKAAPGSQAAKARKASEGFESSFTSSMVEQMFNGMDADGPLGINGPGGGAWRGMLVNEYANSITKAGGVGIAPQVFREMMRHQEVK